MASGGLHPGLVPELVDRCGTDIGVQAGGGVHGHPDGTHAGAKAQGGGRGGRQRPIYRGRGSERTCTGGCPGAVGHRDAPVTEAERGVQL
jgi:hypothetical protein